MKIFVRHVVLDEVTGPLPFGADVDREERRHVRDACGLLHVVRDDDDRVLLLQVLHEVLDAGRCDRVEGRAWLVHQDDVRLDRDGACDAQALLLTAGQGVGVLLELVLDLVPERGATQRVLDDLVEAVLARR